MTRPAIRRELFTLAALPLQAPPIALLQTLVLLFFIQGSAQGQTGPVSSGASPDAQQFSQPSAVPFQLRRDQVAVTETDPSQLIAKAAATDADLNDLATLSADRLCVVGNCGAIFVSEDGGRRWKQSVSPSTGNLHGVAFWSDEEGIAVGCEIGKYTGTSQGIILRTHDGGQTWQSIPSDLPGLRGVQVLSDSTTQTQRIVVWGDYSPQYKTGLFISNGLGAGWQPKKLHLGHLQAVAVGRHPKMGEALLAVDSAGRSAFCGLALASSQVLPAQTETPVGRRTVRAASYVEGSWIIAGDHGLLLETRDAATWNPVSVSKLDPAALRHCHWQSLNKNSYGPDGASIWAAGFPGSIFLRRTKSGWTAVHSGQPLPVHQVHFLDPKRGWAVGAFGKILASRDGGTTWYPQRHEQFEAGLMACVSEWQEAPWSALASTAWEELNLCSVLNFAKQDAVSEANFLPSQHRQLQETAARLGLSLRSTPTDQLSEIQLAVALSTYRPKVVLCDGGRELPKHLLAATHAASNPTPELQNILQSLGLKAWRAEKLARTNPSLKAQVYSEQSQRIINRVGLSIENILAPLPPEEVTRNTSTRMQTFWSQSGNTATQTSLLGGISGRENVVREGRCANYGNFQLIMARGQRRRTLDSFVRREGDNVAWFKDLHFLLTSLPPYELESSLIWLAQQLNSPAQRPRQRHVLEQLISLRPKGDAARWAMLRLLQSDSSQEWKAWDINSPERREVKPIALSQASKQAVAASAVGASPANQQVSPWSTSPFAQKDTLRPAPEPTANALAETPASAVGVQFASADGKVTSDIHSRNDWFATFSRFTRLAPDLMHRPDVQMLVYRNLLDPESPDGSHRLEPLLQAHELVGWNQAASQEILLERNDFQGFRWACFGVRALSRPRLDGMLEEEFWHQAPSTQLSALESQTDETVQAQGAEVHWAYDHEYLYVAAKCPRKTGHPKIQANRIREYDANLAELDHLELLIDSDRDYSTAIQLAVAEDGQTYDRCLESSEYNPKWHVAVKDEGTYWTMELAIGLESLTTDAKVAGDAWSISVRRFIPNKGDSGSSTTGTSESWSKLHSHRRIPAGNGLLLFLPPT